MTLKEEKEGASEAPTTPGLGGAQAERRKGAQAIERVLDMLEAFTADEPELTATALSHRLGLHKTTVHRLASSLLARDLLVRDPKTRAYMLGHGLLRLAERVLNSRDIVSISMPHMMELRARSGETIGLHVRVGWERVCIAQLDSWHEMRMRLELGKPLPLYCGASSKILLAAMEADEVDTVVRNTGLKPLGPGSITDKSALVQDLKAIRENGYAISRAERIAGGATVAAPIRDDTGAVVAGLSIYAPLMRVDDQHLDSWISLVKGAARAVSLEMGYRETSLNSANQNQQDAVTTGRRAREGRREDRAPKGRGGVP